MHCPDEESALNRSAADSRKSRWETWSCRRSHSPSWTTSRRCPPTPTYDIPMAAFDYAAGKACGPIRCAARDSEKDHLDLSNLDCGITRSQRLA